MLYFYLWERGPFVESFLPAMTASRQERSFEPCKALIQGLLPAALAFSERYCLAPGSLLLNQVAEGLAFERHCWRCLVGEILMLGAAEIPEIETAPDSLCCMLAPDRYLEENTPRQRFESIQQIHFGSRDLAFGAGFYRPEHAGWNDRADVERLVDYLARINPGTWTLADLQHHRDFKDDPDRAEELEYVRQWFPALRDLYQRACDKNQVVVCETIS